MAEAFSVSCLSMKGVRIKIYHKDILIKEPDWIFSLLTIEMESPHINVRTCIFPLQAL